MPDLLVCSHCGGTRGPSGCCRELEGDIALLARVVRAADARSRFLAADNVALLRAVDKYRAEIMRLERRRAGARGRVVFWLERLLGL